MKRLSHVLQKLGFFRVDLDYQLLRGSMVVIFFIFGYAKWFEYDEKLLFPFISKGPLTSWLYSVFDMRGADWFLGISEWSIGALLLLGFWNKKLGVLGAAGSIITFVCTLTIIPFLPDAWAAPAGGFPAVTATSAFLMKDVVLLTVSVYLLRQDLSRVGQTIEMQTVGQDALRASAK